MVVMVLKETEVLLENLDKTEGMVLMVKMVEMVLMGYQELMALMGVMVTEVKYHSN